MSPENNKDTILPEEPYAKHYDELDKSQATDKPEENPSAKTEKGFINMKKLLAMGGLALALPAGMHAYNQYQDGNRFPDNYHHVEKQEPVVVAPNAVDIEAAHQAATEPITSKEAVPWVSAPTSPNQLQ